MYNIASQSQSYIILSVHTTHTAKLNYTIHTMSKNNKNWYKFKRSVYFLLSVHPVRHFVPLKATQPPIWWRQIRDCTTNNVDDDDDDQNHNNSNNSTLTEIKKEESEKNTMKWIKIYQVAYF